MPLLLVVAIGGLPLHTALGDRFLGEYSVRAAVVAPALILLSVVILIAIEYRGSPLRQRYPTTWVRWLAWPLFTLTLAGLLFLSGRGWVAGASRLLAHESVAVELAVLSARRHETRRTLCLQYVDLKYKEGVERLCVDQLLVQGKVSAGDKLLAIGVASPLGVHLQALRLQ